MGADRTGDGLFSQLADQVRSPSDSHADDAGRAWIRTGLQNRVDNKLFQSGDLAGVNIFIALIFSEPEPLGIIRISR